MGLTPGFAWPPVLAKLIAGDDLGDEEAAGALASILRGEASEAQVAGFAVALRAKGETVGEMAALARTMREFGERVDVEGPLVDTCGTGGDRAGTLNVSTVAALVVAGAGARVAKHGNRAASSRCGSADLFEALGVAIELGPVGVARCIDEAGIGFLFAPRFHPALRHAMPARRALGVPTTFNFLGPLCNPAGASRQALGVSDPAMAERMAGVLRELGAERTLVFYGHDGLDELTVTTTSTVIEVEDGEVVTYGLDPADYGIPRAGPEALAGGDPAHNADIARRVLEGEPGPARDVVALNAAAGVLVAGLAPTWAEAVDLARSAIDDGQAAAALDRLVQASRAAAAAEG